MNNPVRFMLNTYSLSASVFQSASADLAFRQPDVSTSGGAACQTLAQQPAWQFSKNVL